MDMKDLEQRIQALEDIDAIKKLKAMTWRYFDEQSADELLGCFVDDVVISTAPPAAHEFRGKAQLAEFLKADFAVSVASHQGQGPVIDLTSETTAKAYWSIDEWHHNFRDGVEWKAKGCYEDEYVKVSGRWKIKSIKVKFHFKERHERAR